MQMIKSSTTNMKTTQEESEKQEKREKTRIYLAEWKKKNREKVRAQNAEWKKKNREKVRAYNAEKKNRERARAYYAEWYKKNRDGVLWRVKTRKKTIDANPERKREWKEVRNKYYRQRRKNDRGFVIRQRLSARIRQAVLAAGCAKKNKSTLLVGCTIKHLRTHLEKQFAKGMTWENIELWHIDHIVPCKSFDLTTEQGQRACFHYTNLRPLWPNENSAKGAKIITCQPELPLSLL